MRTRLAALTGALALAAGLSACALDAAYTGPPPLYADMDYDAYYDGFYGQFYGGYWGPGDRFYYWDQMHRRYNRDAERHFSREGMPGYNAVRGHSPPARGNHRGDQGADRRR